MPLNVSTCLSYQSGKRKKNWQNFFPVPWLCIYTVKRQDVRGVLRKSEKKENLINLTVIFIVERIFSKYEVE